MSSHINEFEEYIKMNLNCSHIEIVDDTYKHRNHQAGIEGKKHLRITVVSSCFEGNPLLARHRIVYNLCKKDLDSWLHALSINAYTPSEWNKLSAI